MTPDHDPNEFPFDDSFWEDEEQVEESIRPAWRRRVLIGVALVVAASLLLVPLYNVFESRGAAIAENGLAICGYDYCVVNEAVVAADLDLVQSRLANSILDDGSAGQLVDELARHLDLQPLELRIVDDLEGRLGGFYDSRSRVIVIERPVNAWVVLHEVAHAKAAGHGPEFQAVVVDLAMWIRTVQE